MAGASITTAIFPSGSFALGLMMCIAGFLVCLLGVCLIVSSIFSRQKPKPLNNIVMSSDHRSLNNLPRYVLDEILCLMPIKDAVRTSTLSRFWRHRWKSISRLYLFNLSSAEISKVLFLHSAPIYFFLARENDKWRDADVHRWLAALSRRSLRVLVLQFKLMDNFFDIITIARFLPNLVHLELTCSPVVPALFSGGFPKLRHLHLHHLFAFGGDISRLISGCPLLETLTLGFVRGRQWLDIDAPNLRRLILFRVSFYDFVVTSAPLLEMASIRFCHFDSANLHGGTVRRPCRFMKVFRHMASLKNLVLDPSLLMNLGRGHIPERIPIYFDHLKLISLEVDLGDIKTLAVALCLLRSAPNLQNLALMSCTYSKMELETGNDFWEALECIDLFDKLETMTVTRIIGKKSELGFFQCLLAKARVLKTAMIGFDRGIRNKESFLIKLLEFPRASSQARILLTRG